MSTEITDERAKPDGSSNPSNIVFLDEDLRSKKFTGANLRGAVFERCLFGISPYNSFIIFMIAACLSLIAGYVAMLSGTMLQALLTAKELRLQIAGYILCILFIVFIAIAIWSRLNYRSARAAAMMIVLVIIVGVISYSTGATDGGVGAIYSVAALLLVFTMLIIGAVARATAGSLQSTVIFLIVALGGGVFAKSLGGGIGTLIMTVAAAIISKRALNSTGKSLVKNTALRISTAFGTSFKKADLTGAVFRSMEIKNCNFEGAKPEGIKLEDTTESLCYYGNSVTSLTQGQSKDKS